MKPWEFKIGQWVIIKDEHVCQPYPAGLQGKITGFSELGQGEHWIVNLDVRLTIFGKSQRDLFFPVKPDADLACCGAYKMRLRHL